MDPNPYQSPETSSSPVDERQELDLQWRTFGPRPKRNIILLNRPLGVSVVCILQFVLIPLGLLMTLGSSFTLILAVYARLHISAGIDLGIVMLASIVGMASAAGMWSGMKWGWWAGAFFYAFSLLHTLFACWMLYQLDQIGFLSPTAQAINWCWVVGRIPILLLVYVYFFSDRVLAFMELSQQKKVRVALGIFALAVAAQAAEIGLLCATRIP